MRALHLCFWLHRPYELMGSDHWQKGYFGGAEEFRKADQRDYQPLFALLERNAQRYPKLRVSLVVSGIWLEQAERWDNDLIKRLKKLVQSGNVALVATPYYYSMAAFYDLDELTSQMKQYQEKTEQLFGVKSDFLALPELLYNNRIARWADKNSYKGILAGDTSKSLDWRTSNRVYEAKGTDGVKVLFENVALSQDISSARPAATVQVASTVTMETEDPDITSAAELSAADFVRGMTETRPALRKVKTTKVSEKTEFSAKKFQKQLDLELLRGELVNIYLDVEIFGKWRELGIIGFFDELFKIWQDTAGSHLVSVQEIAKLPPVAEVVVKKTASRKGEAEKDYQLPSWWTPTQDQKSQELYKLRKAVVASEDKDIYQDFGKLTTIEHANGSANFAVIMRDLEDRLATMVTQAQDDIAEPVRFGLSESTNVRVNFDTKAREAKERNQAFYQQMKAAAGEPLWTAEDMDDMEAAIQVMAQRMKMANLEKERDFTNFAEAEIVGTEDDFADMEPPFMDFEEVDVESPQPRSKPAKKPTKKSYKKIVID